MTNKLKISAMQPQGCVSEDRIREFIADLMPAGRERRKHQRIAFHCPVTIYRAGEPVPIAGLLRDISVAGLGLVLDVPLSPGEHTIRIAQEGRKALCAQVQILWCRPVAKHCYLCGGAFMKPYARDPLASLPNESD